ncbi:MAG: hypothetical protein RL149_249 [Actinomycetota bacterium]
MALSDREKQVLEELERNLLADDANFARKAKLRQPGMDNSPAKIVAGALLALIGVSVLVFAAISQVAALGVVGFLVMLFGILMASSNNGAKPRVRAKAAKSKPGSFFEDRWDKRSDG